MNGPLITYGGLFPTAATTGFGYIAVPTGLQTVKVTGEVIDEVKGPKIDILRYMNKTGYRRRQGFRAQQTRVKITAISGVK